MAAAAATGGLLIGDPDTVARACLRRRKRKIVGRGGGCQMGYEAGKLRTGNPALHCTYVQRRRYEFAHEDSAVIFMLRSTAAAECVSAPTEIKSTPVFAYARTVFSVTLP